MKWFKSLVLVGVMAAVLYGVYDYVTKGRQEVAGDADKQPQWKSEDPAEVGVSLGSSDAPPRRLAAGPDTTFPGHTDSPLPELPPHPSAPATNNEGPELGVNQGEAVATDGYPSPGGAASSNPSAEVGVSAQFQADMQEADSLVEQNQLAAALRLLSKWYEDRNLSQQQRAPLVDRLDQLAGVVIYSRQHLLAEPHVVSQGETMQEIGRKYNVHWRLLAKINGVTEQNLTLQAGEELKIIPGPFHAKLDPSRFELTLYLGDYYAGRFPVSLGPQATFTDEVLVVGSRDYYEQPNEVCGQYWMSLGNQQGLHETGNPQTVGGPAQQGCIGMVRQDIDDVFDILNIGSRVTILR